MYIVYVYCICIFICICICISFLLTGQSSSTGAFDAPCLAGRGHRRVCGERLTALEDQAGAETVYGGFLVGGDWNMTGLLFHILNIIIPIDSYFSEGFKSPARFEHLAMAQNYGTIHDPQISDHV